MLWFASSVGSTENGGRDRGDSVGDGDGGKGDEGNDGGFSYVWHWWSSFY
jgi:hypothetical protein